MRSGPAPIDPYHLPQTAATPFRSVQRKRGARYDRPYEPSWTIDRRQRGRETPSWRNRPYLRIQGPCGLRTGTNRPALPPTVSSPPISLHPARKGSDTAPFFAIAIHFATLFARSLRSKSARKLERRATGRVYDHTTRSTSASAPGEPTNGNGHIFAPTFSTLDSSKHLAPTTTWLAAFATLLPTNRCL